eukprot:scaffold47252_cov18-Tisochrysis_lutea.AAC.1
MPQMPSCVCDGEAERGCKSEALAKSDVVLIGGVSLCVRNAALSQKYFWRMSEQGKQLCNVVPAVLKYRCEPSSFEEGRNSKARDKSAK